jgi:peptidoglycan biosynthesis protein MviN/MurJ (putative lipid II flippase)
VLGTLSYTFVHALYMGIVIYLKHYKSVKPSYDMSFYKKISVTGGIQVITNILFILMNALFVRMKPGGYSYVEYSERLTMFVFMLVANNLSQIITPILSKLKDMPEEYRENCKKFFSMTMYLVILPTIFMFLYANEIIKAVYTNNGKTNLDLLGNALKHVAISMPFWNIKRMLLTFFECKRELKQQNITGLIYNISIFVLGLFFMKYEIFSHDHLAIIWSWNLGVMIEIVYLLYASHKKEIFTLNFNIILDLFLHTISSIAIIYTVNYFIINNSIWFILLKGTISLGIFAGIFYKDTIKFFNVKK